MPAGDGAGVLVLAATPIGTLDDASPRLRSTLAEADIIAAEDTRRLSRLLAGLGVTAKGRIVSYFEGNEARRTRELVEALRSGLQVVVVTDAGMPSVSDPGFRLVTAAIEAGIPVTAVPGPSAVPTALAVSGLPVDRFCFEGFLPRKAGERRTRLRELAEERRTMVFFEAPHRLAATLEAMVEAFGADRPAAVCRELTKMHEEVRRGSLADLLDWARQGVRGEVTVVVGGAPATAPAAVDEAELARLVAARVADGATQRDAIADVARETGVRRREVYAAVVTARERGDSPRNPDPVE